MAKIIEARVIQKIDTEQNWNANELILYKGEIALVGDPDRVYNIKVGNGSKVFRDLPYMVTYTSGLYTGVITPTSTVPSGTNNAFLVTQAGTYTNFGGVVLPVNSLGVIFKNGNSYTITVMTMTQEFMKIGLGYGTKFKNDNISRYTTPQLNSVDFSFKTTTGGGGASGAYSFASGINTTASGEYSFASGYNTTASGTYSFTSGEITTASSNHSFAIGYSTTASGAYSFASGIGSNARGVLSISSGIYNIADSYCHIVFGRYNIISNGNASSWINTNMLFQIGNGSSDNNRSDALTVFKNGLVTLPSVNSSLQDSALKAVITKDYLDLRIPKPPTTGNYRLRSVNGVVSWVAE